MTGATDTDPDREVTRPAGWSRPAAALAVAAVLGASAALGRRNAPDDAHPRVRRWYRRLDKPGFTPPDVVFGAVWPVLETGLAAGGYRLLRHPPTPTRNVAVGLWLANFAMVGGWTELFFRRQAIGASTAAAGTMTLGAGAGRDGGEGRPARGGAGNAVRRLARLCDAARRPRSRAQSDVKRVTVWHDGACPLCAREVALIHRLDRAGHVRFVDAADVSTVCPLDRGEMLARFHAQEEGGPVVSGAAAFAAMWRAVPLLRPLGLLARNERVLALLERLYLRFLRARPRLQRLRA